MKSRRDAREAEGARLEIVYPANHGIVGSTPTLSAIFCYAKNGGEVSPSEVNFGEADSPFNSVIRNLARSRRLIFTIMMDSPAILDMYYVYILLNETKTRTYTGVTDDIDKRLTEHNAGRVKSSSPYRPYRIAYFESFRTLSEARHGEKFYKSTSGRRELKKMFFT